MSVSVTGFARAGLKRDVTFTSRDDGAASGPAVCTAVCTLSIVEVAGAGENDDEGTVTAGVWGADTAMRGFRLAGYSVECSSMGRGDIPVPTWMFLDRIGERVIFALVDSVRRRRDSLRKTGWMP